jgi:hypothetical protein
LSAHLYLAQEGLKRAEFLFLWDVQIPREGSEVSGADTSQKKGLKEQ